MAALDIFILRFSSPLDGLTSGEEDLYSCALHRFAGFYAHSDYDRLADFFTSDLASFASCLASLKDFGVGVPAILSRVRNI